MIQAIFFDWGGVLIENPNEALLTYFSKKLKVDPETLDEAFIPQKEELQKGRITEEEFWEKVCAKLDIKVPKSKSLWKEAADKVSVYQKEVYTIMDELKKQEIPLGCLSNTEPGCRDHFLKKKQNAIFDKCIFSCNIGNRKPEKEIFEHALKEMGTRSGDTLFIDDRPENIEGARRCGMKGIRFRSAEKLIKELSRLSIRVF